MSLQPELRRVMEHRETLTRDEARALMHRILTEPPAEVELAALVGALAARGETPAELAGFVDAMRASATPLPLTDAERDALVDTCGTGGDSSGTFNISTAAALVAAAAGATVAKHGNRAVTSRSGSADVLEALGIPVDLPPAEAADALRRHRFAFLHAPAHHPAMRAVMPVRRALGVRTAFNLLGPLANPAGAARQVMGVFGSRQVRLVAETMALLGTRHALVVHGSTGAPTPAHLPHQAGPSDLSSPLSRSAGGMDELSVSGPTELAEVLRVPPSSGSPQPASTSVRLFELTPEAASLPRSPIAALTGADPAANAAILTRIFAGAPGAPRDVVLLNAAAVLLTADLAPDLRAGITRAAHAIDSGAVTELVATLRRTSSS